MGLLLAASRVYVPGFMRKRKLSLLFQATADAFRVGVPELEGLSYGESLKLYAQFSAALAERSIREGSSGKVQSRLFQNARRLGQQFKADFKLHNPDEGMQLGAVIYKVLKMEFQGDSLGNIVIKRCFFSNYYSNEVCRFVSALDEGLLVGLLGGGKLGFSQRITAGYPCCKARFQASGEHL
jgi:hypothetical protein